MFDVAAERLRDAAADLPTPCLIVDRAAADRNIALALRQAGAIRVRPHFKAHKSTMLLRRQVPSGEGVTCATAYEALVLAEAGFSDILVANEVVDGASLVALASVATIADVTVAVDHLGQVARLVEAASRADVVIGVLVEIDVGHHRCGIEPRTSRLLELAKAVDAAPHLRLRGIMGYEGHAALETDSSVRRRLVADATSVLARERDRLLLAGFACEIVSGGATGTLGLASDFGVLTEVQAGSYVLMDGQYGDLDLGFEQALYCLVTVVSVRPGQIVANAGLKSLNGDGPPPAVLHPEMVVDRVNDEHAIIRAGATASAKLGDRLLLIPSHVDPTVNLHDVLYAVDEAGSVTEWPVDGRRHRSQAR